MMRRILHAWAAIVLIVGVLALACGLAGDHPLLEIWKPVR